MKRKSDVAAAPGGRQSLVDGRLSGPVHGWFELSYSHYLVLPRSLMQAMPIEWQERMADCLEEMHEACEPLEINDRYTVLLRGEKGRIVSDPYSDYRHPKIHSLPIEASAPTASNRRGATVRRRF